MVINMEENSKAVTTNKVREKRRKTTVICFISNHF